MAKRRGDGVSVRLEMRPGSTRARGGTGTGPQLGPGSKATTWSSARSWFGLPKYREQRQRCLRARMLLLKADVFVRAAEYIHQKEAAF